jgi:hypothetical protein
VLLVSLGKDRSSWRQAIAILWARSQACNRATAAHRDSRPMVDVCGAMVRWKEIRGGHERYVSSRIVSRPPILKSRLTDPYGSDSDSEGSFAQAPSGPDFAPGPGHHIAGIAGRRVVLATGPPRDASHRQGPLRPQPASENAAGLGALARARASGWPIPFARRTRGVDRGTFPGRRVK